MCVSRSRNNNNNSNFGAHRPALSIGSNAIVFVNEMNNLSVIVDTHLDFKLQINKIVAWAFVAFAFYVSKCESTKNQYFNGV